MEFELNITRHPDTPHETLYAAYTGNQIPAPLDADAYALLCAAHESATDLDHEMASFLHVCDEYYAWLASGKVDDFDAFLAYYRSRFT